MKHRIFSGIIAVLFLQFLLSCNKQLNEYNPGGATVESLFTSPEGFEAAVNGAYTYNRSFYGKEEGVGLLEVGTDIWTSAATDQQPSLTTYQGLTPDQAWIKTKMWQPCYAGINLCNLALKYIDNAGLATTRKPVLEGELRFLRAWYYWHLVETFGDTHFTLESTEGMVTTANRTSVDKIYDQIFIDMAIAVNNLPPTTADYGRITKPAAEAFLARLYLTRGKNQEASNLAYGVIKNYGFKLLSNYADLWNMSNQRNTEVVWATNYSTTLTNNSGSNLMHTLFLMDYNTLPGMKTDLVNGYANKRYMPTLFLLNLFNENDDARYNASFKQAWIANNSDPVSIPKWTGAEAANNAAELTPLIDKPKFTVGDTAVLITKYAIDDFEQKYTTRYRYRTYDVNDVYNADGTPKDRSHYISLKKFDDPTRASANETQSSRDVFMIRLAEMYLIASEAQMKLGKMDSAAYFVNEVRTRAAVPGHAAAMQVGTGAITLDFLLDERARELAGELLRWFDLKRTNKLVERITNYNWDAKPYIKDYHIVRPIPQSQIDAVTNKNEFKQTLGYN